MDCVDVCPVDCFYEGENMLVIHPDECIDCGVCVPECPVEFLSTKIGALQPNASMLFAIALICARPCLRGLSGSGMRSPIATNKICRRVAKWAVVGIVLFMVVIPNSQSLAASGEEAARL